MNIQELTNLIKNGTSQEIKNAQVHKLIRDTTLPLDQRWNLYTLAVYTNDLVNIDYFYFIPDTVDEDSLNDRFSHNRHSQYDYSEFTDDYVGTSEDLVKLKESILKDGHSEWTFDW